MLYSLKTLFREKILFILIDIKFKKFVPKFKFIIFWIYPNYYEMHDALFCKH